MSLSIVDVEVVKSLKSAGFWNQLTDFFQKQRARNMGRIRGSTDTHPTRSDWEMNFLDVFCGVGSFLNQPFMPDYSMVPEHSVDEEHGGQQVETVDLVESPAAPAEAYAGPLQDRTTGTFQNEGNCAGEDAVVSKELDKLVNVSSDIDDELDDNWPDVVLKAEGGKLVLCRKSDGSRVVAKLRTSIKKSSINEHKQEERMPHPARIEVVGRTGSTGTKKKPARRLCISSDDDECDALDKKSTTKATDCGNDADLEVSKAGTLKNSLAIYESVKTATVGKSPGRNMWGSVRRKLFMPDSGNGSREVTPVSRCTQAKKKKSRKVVMSPIKRLPAASKHFKCNLCGTRLSSERNLRRHVEEKHLAENPKQRWACDRCGVTYSHERSLKDHIATHDYKFQCEFCSHIFRTRQSVNSHIERTHKKELADRETK